MNLKRKTILEPAVLAAVRSHARAVAPAECCGALFGRHEDGCRLIERAVAVPNAAAEPETGFHIGPRSVLALEAEAARHGLELLGFYHSHPNGTCAPSDGDLGAAWPGYTYVIAGRDGVAAWRLRADRDGFERESCT